MLQRVNDKPRQPVLTLGERTCCNDVEAMRSLDRRVKLIGLSANALAHTMLTNSYHPQYQLATRGCLGLDYLLETM